MSWDLLDETGSHVVEEVVEDENQIKAHQRNGGHMDGNIIPPKNKLSWKVQGSQNSKLQGFDFIMCRKLIC